MGSDNCNILLTLEKQRTFYRLNAWRLNKTIAKVFIFKIDNTSQWIVLDAQFHHNLFFVFFTNNKLITYVIDNIFISRTKIKTSAFYCLEKSIVFQITILNLINLMLWARAALAITPRKMIAYAIKHLLKLFARQILTIN